MEFIKKGNHYMTSTNQTIDAKLQEAKKTISEMK